MKKHLNRISSILLFSLSGCIALTCCSVAKSLTQDVSMQKHDDEEKVPRDLLNIDENQGILYGFAEGVTAEKLYTEGYTKLDLTANFLKVSIKKIAPYAFINQLVRPTSKIVSLALPEQIEEIGRAAFYGCTALTGQLFLPQSLKVIDSDAFFYNAFSGNLIIPEGVERIGVQAFWHLDLIKGTLKIPSSVKEVGFRAFKGLNPDVLDLSEYSAIPAWMCKQGTIFQDIGSKKEVKVQVSTNENTIDEWKTVLSAQGVFDNAKYESSSEKVTEEWCFLYEDSQHTKVTGFANDFDITQYTTLRFPSKVTTINSEAFKDKIKDNIKFEWTNNIQEIGEKAFQNCSGLICKNLSIPVETRKIGNNAFENCNGITGILTFPNDDMSQDGYVIDGNEIFKGCKGITGIVAKKSDHFNGYGIFQNCSSISYIDLSDYKEKTLFKDLWPQAKKDPLEHLSLDGISETGMVYYDAEAGTIDPLDLKLFFSNASKIDVDTVEEAQADPAKRSNWQVQGFAEEAAIPDLDGYVLKNKEACYGIASEYKGKVCSYNTIRIPNTVTSIESNAFKGVLQPKEGIHRFNLILNIGVNEIKDSAFEDCNGIVDQLLFPCTIQKIGDKSFSNCCDIIGSLEFPRSIQSIGIESFNNTRINTIIFKDQIRNIGAKAFTNSKFVKIVDLTCFNEVPSDLVIGENAFAFTGDKTTDPSSSGTVYVHANTQSAWNTLLKSKGLPSNWEVKEVA